MSHQPPISYGLAIAGSSREFPDVLRPYLDADPSDVEIAFFARGDEGGFIFHRNHGNNGNMFKPLEALLGHLFEVGYSFTEGQFVPECCPAEGWWIITALNTKDIPNTWGTPFEFGSDPSALCWSIGLDTSASFAEAIRDGNGILVRSAKS